MRKLLVSEFMTLDGVMQAPGGKDEDRDGGFEHGRWTVPYWHDDIGRNFFALMKEVDALLLGRRTYVTHAEAFEPMPPGDPFGPIWLIPRQLLAIFGIQDPAVVPIGAELLRVLSVSGLFVAAALPLGICFVIQRTGTLQPIHIWLAILAGHAARFSLSFARFRQGRWRAIAVDIRPAVQQESA